MPVTGRGDAATPKLGHGQPGLCLNHHGEGLVDCIALHVPAGQAGELEVVVCAGRLCHLAETKVQAFSQQHGQHPDLILAGRAGMQMGEGLREPDIRIDFLHQLRDPYTAASHAEIRGLAGLVFDMADQVQELFRARRRALDLEVTEALRGLATNAGRDCSV